MLVGLSGYIGSGKDTVASMVQYLTNTEPDSRKVFKGETITNFQQWQSLTSDYPGYTGNSTWKIKKFAGKLKQIVSLLTGIPVGNLEKESVKSSELGKEWAIPLRVVSPKGTPRLGPNQYLELSKSGDSKFIMQSMTVRALLQNLGTDAMRDQVHPNIHVNALFADYNKEYPKTVGGNFEYPNWIISDLRFPNEFQAIKDRGGICIRINREQTLKPGTLLHSSETALDQVEFDYTINNSGTLQELLEQVRTMLLHFKIIT